MNTIKARIFFSVGIFALFFIFIIYAGYQNLNTARKIRDLQFKVTNANNKLLSIINKDLELISRDKIKNDFYINKNFSGFVKRKEIFKELINRLNEINDHPALESLIFSDEFDLLTRQVYEYDSLQNSLIELQRERGFRDFGLEGEMRNQAHALEKYEKVISLQAILTLRRHEKDYFLRGDPNYIYKYNKLSDSLQSMIVDRSVETAEVRRYLRDYQALFNSVAELEEQIGDINSGLIKEINHSQKQIENQFNLISQSVNLAAEITIKKLVREYLILILLGFAISGVLSSLTGYFATSSIKRLADSMKKSINTNFKSEVSKPLKWSSSETKSLFSSYEQLINMIRKQLNELKYANSNLEEKNQTLARINGMLAESEKELRKSNEVKERFLKIIGHDLRGPMANLTELLNVLFTDISHFNENETQSFANNILTSANSISLLLEKLIAWSQSQADKVTVFKEEINIYQIFENNSNLFKPKLKKKSIELIVKCKKDLYAYADENMIDFVVRNLLDNAIKFSQEGGEILLIGTKIENEVSITVKDSGIGINSEELEKILESGGKHSRLGTFGEKGLGLGLMLTHEFVKKNNGLLIVKSKIDNGAKFTIRLPADQFSKVEERKEDKLIA